MYKASTKSLERCQQRIRNHLNEKYRSGEIIFKTYFKYFTNNVSFLLEPLRQQLQHIKKICLWSLIQTFLENLSTVLNDCWKTFKHSLNHSLNNVRFICKTLEIILRRIWTTWTTSKNLLTTIKISLKGIQSTFERQLSNVQSTCKTVYQKITTKHETAFETRVNNKQPAALHYQGITRNVKYLYEALTSLKITFTTF